MREIALLGVAAMATITLVGCGGDGGCELEAGQYEGTFTEVRGDCGAIPTLSIAVREGGYPIFGGGMDCDSTTVDSDDGCVASTEARCHQDGNEIDISSTVMYVSPTSAEATAEVTVEATDGSFCQSRYDVTWEKL